MLVKYRSHHLQLIWKVSASSNKLTFHKCTPFTVAYYVYQIKRCDKYWLFMWFIEAWYYIDASTQSVPYSSAPPRRCRPPRATPLEIIMAYLPDKKRIFSLPQSLPPGLPLLFLLPSQRFSEILPDVSVNFISRYIFIRPYSRVTRRLARS